MSSPRRRNIVEARCDMDCRVYTFYPRASLKNATLKSDIYAILENDDVNISAGNNLTKFSNTRMKNTDYCSIDAERRRSIFLSNSTKITSFEIAENKMGKEQFSITRPSEKFPFYYTIPVSNPNTIQTTRISLLEKTQSAFKLDYHAARDMLYILLRTVVLRVDMGRECQTYMTGFGHNATDIVFTNDLIAISCYDSLVYLFDARTKSIPTMKLKGHGENVNACEIANIDGTPFVFSGGKDQCIRVWDIRMQVPLYELSAGNNVVTGLHWHDASSTLLCATNYWPEFSDQDYDESDWNSNAYHSKTHFAKHFHLERGAFVCYQFKDIIEGNKLVQQTRTTKSSPTKSKHHKRK
ncbi:hypothetical protein FDP41_013771 [Naegleria fowleri]|nr:uncharacterized protein FDP41_013771 [Naegleria fowleri]KAF0980122.1 hypothetical protein FDP41_013771 [Naegleria fowleri]